MADCNNIKRKVTFTVTKLSDIYCKCTARLLTGTKSKTFRKSHVLATSTMREFPSFGHPMNSSLMLFQCIENAITL